jgi:hypothetical protein
MDGRTHMAIGGFPEIAQRILRHFGRLSLSSIPLASVFLSAD